MPERSTLPGAVEDLIERYFESIDSMRVLLAIHAEPKRSWSCREVADVAGLDHGSASRQLVRLRQAGLLSVKLADDATYGYAASGDLARAVDELKACFQARPLDVVALIAARSERRLKHFADAFRFRKDR